jgi:hypothetical protein
MKKIFTIIVTSSLMIFLSTPVWASIQTTAFAKSYRLKDLSDGLGLSVTRDGSYLVTGSTVFDKAMADNDAFLMKVGGQGNGQWARLFQSKSSTKSAGTGNNGGEYGLATSELIDGSILLAGRLDPGFITNDYLKYKEAWGDIFLSKFNKNGGHLWTKMVGDYGYDDFRQLLATTDNGWLLVNSISETGFGDDIADQEAVPKFTVIDKYQANGKRDWLKKINLSQVTIAPTTDAWVGVGQLTGDSLFSTLPVAFKIDKNGNLIWAKRLESAPLTISNVSVGSSSNLILGSTNFHLPLGDFRTIVATPDAGCLVIGRLSLVSNGATSDTKLVALKLGADGEYQWTRTISLARPLIDSAFMENFTAISTKDNNLALVGEFTKQDTEAQNRVMTLGKRIKEFYAQYNLSPGQENKTSASKKAWAQIIKISTDTIRPNWRNSLIIKTNLDFQPLWAKAIGNSKAITVNNLIPGNDGGVVAVGTYETQTLNFTKLGIKHYFKEAVLIKLDVNGGTADNRGLISDYELGEGSEINSYLFPAEADVFIRDFKYKIEASPKPITPIQKVKISELFPWKSYLLE